MRVKKMKISALNYKKLEKLIQKTSADPTAQPLPCREGILEQTKSGCRQRGNTGKCASSGTLLRSQGCCAPPPSFQSGIQSHSVLGVQLDRGADLTRRESVVAAFTQGLPSEDPQEWVLGTGHLPRGSRESSSTPSSALEVPKPWVPM